MFTMTNEQLQIHLKALQEARDSGLLEFRPTDEDVWSRATRYGMFNYELRLKPQPVVRWGVVDDRGRWYSIYDHEENAVREASRLKGHYFKMVEEIK